MVAQNAIISQVPGVIAALTTLWTPSDMVPGGEVERSHDSLCICAWHEARVRARPTNADQLYQLLNPTSSVIACRVGSEPNNHA